VREPLESPARRPDLIHPSGLTPKGPDASQHRALFSWDYDPLLTGTDRIG